MRLFCAALLHLFAIVTLRYRTSLCHPFHTIRIKSLQNLRSKGIACIYLVGNMPRDMVQLWHASCLPKETWYSAKVTWKKMPPDLSSSTFYDIQRRWTLPSFASIE